MSSAYDALWSEVESVYQREGIGTRVGGGTKPALLVIDVQVQWMTGRHRAIVEPTARLIEACRARGVPVFYTQFCVRPDSVGNGPFKRKWVGHAEGRVAVEGSPEVEFIAELAPKRGDFIIGKRRYSAFFGTELDLLLRDLGVDTLLLTGITLSGCVRATAYDAFQLGYRVLVPRECVSDRHELIAESNLFDINAKLGDVISLDEALRYIDEINSGMA